MACTSFPNSQVLALGIGLSSALEARGDGADPTSRLADVPIKKHSSVYFTGTCSHGEPTVKYRGICEYRTNRLSETISLTISWLL